MASRTRLISHKDDTLGFSYFQAYIETLRSLLFARDVYGLPGGPTVVSVAFTREDGWLLFNCAPLTPIVILCFGDLGRACVVV